MHTHVKPVPCRRRHLLPIERAFEWRVELWLAHLSIAFHLGMWSSPFVTMLGLLSWIRIIMVHTVHNRGVVDNGGGGLTCMHHEWRTLMVSRTFLNAIDCRMLCWGPCRSGTGPPWGISCGSVLLWESFLHYFQVVMDRWLFVGLYQTIWEILGFLEIYYSKCFLFKI